MKHVAEDNLPVTKTFVDEMYFCLDCQACQTVCPAGVQYGALVENARGIIAQRKKDPLRLRLIKKVFLSGVLASKRRLRVFAQILDSYARSGLRSAFELSGVLSLFSKRLDEQHAMLPRMSGRSFSSDVPEILKASNGSARGRVAFLSGCIMDFALAHVHDDAVEVLRAAGYDVVIPKRQECCGSLHGHNGEVEESKRVARLNLDVFDDYSFDYLVVDSAGCGAFLKEYGGLLAEDERYSKKAISFSAKVKDITEFLSENSLPPLRPLRTRVTYHEACHLVHTQKISAQPRALIQSIPGIEFVELPEATWCCGSAGIYNVVRFEDSMDLLERKMNNLASTKADIVATANPGCHFQLQYGIKKFGLKMEVVHPVSLIRRAIAA